MENGKYDSLKLKNQLCFPVYSAARHIIRLYTPYLKKLNLTYMQYVTMMVLWEEKQSNLKDLGKKLYLDSGTLTPLLKELEKKGYVNRCRLEGDERFLSISLTPEGEALKDKALHIPTEMTKCVFLTKEESLELYHLMYKLLSVVKED